MNDRTALKTYRITGVTMDIGSNTQLRWECAVKEAPISTGTIILLLWQTHGNK